MSRWEIKSSQVNGGKRGGLNWLHWTGLKRLRPTERGLSADWKRLAHCPLGERGKVYSAYGMIRGRGVGG